MTLSRDHILSDNVRARLREAGRPRSSPLLDAATRALDVFGALTGLILTSPIMIAAAVAIKLEGDGPVIFRQARLGHKGETFYILKFRSMIPNASAMGAGFRSTRNDDRITRVGHVLRDYRIDELPQLINVLTGEMSLVGPRPTLPFHKDYYEPWEMARLDIRPGITGLSQVLGANALNWDDRIVIDVHYVHGRNLWLYLWILVRTVLNLRGKDGVVNAEGQVRGWTRGVPEAYRGDV